MVSSSHHGKCLLGPEHCEGTVVRSYLCAIAPRVLCSCYDNHQVDRVSIK